MNTTLQAVYLLIAVSAFIPSALYVTRYHIKSRGAWRDHHLGKTIMVLGTVLTVFLAFIGFNNVWFLLTGGSYVLRAPITLLLFAVFALALWRQWWSFEKIQHEMDKETKREKRNDDVQ